MRRVKLVSPISFYLAGNNLRAGMASGRVRPVVPINPMRNDYLLAASKVIDDPYILVNVISRRVKQLRRGFRPLVESLEKMSPEDTALREVAEGKISYELASVDELARSASPASGRASSAHNHK